MQCLFCIEEIPSEDMNRHVQHCHAAMLSRHPSRDPAAYQRCRSDVHAKDLNFMSHGSWKSGQHVPGVPINDTIGACFSPQQDIIDERPTKRRKLTHSREHSSAAKEAIQQDDHDEEEEGGEDAYCGLPYLWHLATYCEPKLERCGPYDMNRRIDIYEALQLQAREQTIKHDRDMTPQPLNTPCAWHSTQHKHDHTLAMQWTERDQIWIDELVRNYDKFNRHKPDSIDTAAAAAAEYDSDASPRAPVLLAHMHALTPTSINESILNDLQHYNFIRHADAPPTVVEPESEPIQMPPRQKSRGDTDTAFISGVTASDLSSRSSSISAKTKSKTKSKSPRRTPAIAAAAAAAVTLAAVPTMNVIHTRNRRPLAPVKPTAAPAATALATTATANSNTNAYNPLLLPTLNMPSLNKNGATAKPAPKQQQTNQHMHHHHHQHPPRNHNNRNPPNTNDRRPQPQQQQRHNTQHQQQQQQQMNSLQLKSMLTTLARHPNFGNILQHLATDAHAKSQLLAVLREMAANQQQSTTSAVSSPSRLQSNMNAYVVPPQLLRVHKPTATPTRQQQQQQHHTQACLSPVLVRRPAVEVPSLVRCPPSSGDNHNESPTSSTTINSMNSLNSLNAINAISTQQSNGNNNNSHNMLWNAGSSPQRLQNSRPHQQKHMYSNSAAAASNAAFQQLLASIPRNRNKFVQQLNGKIAKQPSLR